jgi:asparagine synthase (glutamine-hydrolysing)
MSGIYGVLHPPGRQAMVEELTPMRTPTAIWGDAGGEHADGPAALGAVLHTDAPWSVHERQPLVRGSLTLVADARLDARDELCRELCIEPATRSATPDSELLLRAYERWGERCCERLLGAWALALWDAGRGTLLLARDHIGQRPLTWTNAGGTLLFATEEEALLARPDVPRVEDEEIVLARLLRMPQRLVDRTVWAGVHKVPPGGGLIVRPGEPPRAFTHWRPAPRPPLVLEDSEAYADALRETVATAVADQARTVHPVAAHLSGGLDSSSIAMLGARALAPRGESPVLLLSWSPAPNGMARSEQLRVEEVAKDIGAPIVWLELDEADHRAHADREASLVPNEMRLTEERLLPVAQAHGAGIVLSGWGGDELASFNGRGRLGQLLISGRWRALVHEATAPARREGRGRLYTARTLRARLAREALPAAFPRLARPSKPIRRLQAIDAKLYPRAPALLAERRRSSHPLPSPRSTQIRLLENGHLTMRIESWARAAAERGMAYRYPLLDRRVMDLCLAFPEDVWMRDGVSRWVYRAACGTLLPSSLVWGRPKDEPARGELVTARLERASPRPAAGAPFMTSLLQRRAELSSGP